VTNESGFDALIDVETVDPERARLRHARNPLFQAGLPPGLTPRRQRAHSVGVIRMRHRRSVKRPVLHLLAAALSIAAVFVSGYAVGDHRGGIAPRNTVIRTLALRGTSVAPHARARLEVRHARGGNWPMTLSVVGLPKLPPHTYYEVDLVRGEEPWRSSGTFRITSAAHAVTLTLNAPYALRKDDSWIVTRQASGREGGVTVLRPI
jgi:hypothetical protein